MGDSGTPLLYSQSPSSAFSLFPTNGLYLSADSASTSPHARERQHQPPRAMLCTALGPYNTAPFSVADSPDSSSGSGSLSNTDGSPPESPVDDIHGADHTHGFGYSHDLFDQQFRAMFTSQVGDPLSYPGSNALEMSHHYIIKHEHQQAAIYDSYQPFLDSCSEPISPYSNSQQFRATDDSSEHFGTSSAAALLPPVYEFPGQYHSQTGRSIAATPLASSDPDTSAGIDAGYMLTAASHVRYTGGTSHNDMTQQPRAQLSPRCVRITEYSPSPPLYDTSELDDAQVCDPRFVSGSEDGGRLADVNRRYKPRDGVLSASSTIAPTSPFNHDVSHDSEEEVQEQDDKEDDEYKDSGESEIEQDLRDDDDGEFMLRPNRRTRFNQNTRANRAATSELSLSSHSSSSLSAGALDVQMPTGDVLVKRTRGLTAPVPVPNLTKKSRGRRVPTVSTIVAHGGVQKNTRMYTCKVKDCGKCFARGEHLKRHVRSIHTNEKPHKCPFPGCGKDFSRHDNLGQHMRVHKTHQATRDFV